MPPSSDGGSTLSSDWGAISYEHLAGTAKPMVPPTTIDSPALAGRDGRCLAATLRLRIHWIRLLKYRIGPNMWRYWTVLGEDGSVTWTYPAPLKKSVTKISLTAPKWEKTKDKRGTQPPPPGPGVMRFMLQANRTEIQRMGGVQSLSSLTSQLRALHHSEGKSASGDDYPEDYWSVKPADPDNDQGFSSVSVVRQPRARKPASFFGAGQNVLTKRSSIEPFLVVSPTFPHVEINEPIPYTAVGPSSSLELSPRDRTTLPNPPSRRNSSQSSQTCFLGNDNEQENVSDSDDSSKPSSITSRRTFGQLARSRTPSPPLQSRQSRRWSRLYASLDLASVRGMPGTQPLELNPPATLVDAYDEGSTLDTHSKSDTLAREMPTCCSLLSPNPSLATGIDVSLYPVQNGPVAPRRLTSGRHREPQAGVSISTT